MPFASMRTTGGASSQRKLAVASLRRHAKRRRRSWRLSMRPPRPRAVLKRRLPGRLLKKAVGLSMLTPEYHDPGLSRQILVLHFDDYEYEPMTMSKTLLFDPSKRPNRDFDVAMRRTSNDDAHKPPLRSDRTEILMSRSYVRAMTMRNTLLFDPTLRTSNDDAQHPPLRSDPTYEQ